MRTIVFAALALACVFVPQASAKGPIALCGPAACATLGSETSLRWWGPADGSHVAPPAPAQFFKLRFSAHEGDPLAYWVPSTGLLRTGARPGGPVWFQPSSEEAALLTQAAASLQPFTAPTRANVTVEYRSVPRGDWSYLRLFTMGTPVPGANTRTWLPVDMWGPDTPWTNCVDCLLVSRTDAYLKRSGDVMRIPLRIAYRVRHRLPLR
ncbi:MAG TPA: hypothetical protein VGQ15_09515 [Gaiellaceae bacterium]|jgi:hypothetical protein|nr:hypothetical protein [Gaiellaceae bacterium]